MYLFMFFGVIYLCYNMKKVNCLFCIGKKGNGLMWIVGGFGFFGLLLVFIFSFILFS